MLMIVVADWVWGLENPSCHSWSFPRTLSENPEKLVRAYSIPSLRGVLPRSNLPPRVEMEIASFSEFTLSQSKGKFRNDTIELSVVVLGKQSQNPSLPHGVIGNPRTYIWIPDY